MLQKNKAISRMEKSSVDVKKQHMAPVGASSESSQEEGDKVLHLLEKPFFDSVLTKSHIEKSCSLLLPAHIIRLLPRATVPVILRYNGKNWNLSYIGDCSRPRFDSEWRGFATDNDLKCGDACVFELMENSKKILRFKVHILRGDLPTELVVLMDTRGKTLDCPIVLD